MLFKGTTGQNIVRENMDILGHYSSIQFKGIVVRDFGGLQMILMYGDCVPDVPLEFLFSYSSLNLKF